MLQSVRSRRAFVAAKSKSNPPGKEVESMSIRRMVLVLEVINSQSQEDSESGGLPRTCPSTDARKRHHSRRIDAERSCVGSRRCVNGARITIAPSQLIGSRKDAMQLKRYRRTAISRNGAPAPNEHLSRFGGSARSGPGGIRSAGHRSNGCRRSGVRPATHGISHSHQ